MSTGTIVAVNERRGMFLVRLDDGGFAAFELLDSVELEPGCKVSGNLDATGPEKLLHLDTGQRFDAYGQSGPSSLEAAAGIVKQQRGSLERGE